VAPKGAHGRTKGAPIIHHIKVGQKKLKLVKIKIGNLLERAL